MTAKLAGFTQHESDYIAYAVESLRDEMWGRHPEGTRERVFAYCTDLRNFGMMAGAEVGQSVAERFHVSRDEAGAMVGAWLAHTRKGAP